MVKYLHYKDMEGNDKYCHAGAALSGLVPDIPAPLPYVALVCEQRADDVLHVTDLNNSARYNKLMKETDFIVDLDSSFYRVMGVASHSALEKRGGVHSEFKLEMVVDKTRITGTADLVVEGQGGVVIIDYKILGSYSVTKLFGMYQTDEVILEPDGTPAVYKSGEKKGQRKTRKVWLRDESKRDIKNYLRQLNIYGLMYKDMTGIDVVGLKLFVGVRDGGTEAARSRGIMRNTYLIELPVGPEEKVLAFIRDRIAQNSLPLEACPICTEEESWGGNRCKGYCPVALECARRFNDNPWLGQADLERLMKEEAAAKASSEL